MPDQEPTLMAFAFGIGLLVVIVGVAAALGAFGRNAFEKSPMRACGIGTQDVGWLVVLWVLGKIVALAVYQVGQSIWGQPGKKEGEVVFDSAAEAWMKLAMVVVMWMPVVLLVVVRTTGVGGGLRWGHGVIDGLKELGLIPTRYMRDLFYGVGGWVIAMPLMFGLGVAVQLIMRLFSENEPPTVAHDMLKQLQESSDPSTQWGIVIAAIIAAPFFEELVFRGVLQTALWRFYSTLWLLLARAKQMKAKRLAMQNGQAVVGEASDVAEVAGGGSGVDASGGDVAGDAQAQHMNEPSLVKAEDALKHGRWFAVIFAAICFGLIHAPVVDASVLPVLIAFGFFLGWLYEKTGSLWPSIVVHALYNAANVAIVMWVLPNMTT